MSKNAQAALNQQNNKQNKPRKLTDKEALYLKLEMEADIRMRLDEFAREMALAKADRNRD